MKFLINGNFRLAKILLNSAFCTLHSALCILHSALLLSPINQNSKRLYVTYPQKKPFVGTIPFFGFCCKQKAFCLNFVIGIYFSAQKKFIHVPHRGQRVFLNSLVGSHKCHILFIVDQKLIQVGGFFGMEHQGIGVQKGKRQRVGCIGIVGIRL